MIAEDMVSRAVKLVECFLGDLKIRKGLLFDWRGVLVLEITELDEEVYLLCVHQSHALGQLIEGLAVEARANGIGVSVMAVRDNSETYRTQPGTRAAL